MSCENCLSRREFLTRGTLAVAGVATIASACGDGQFGPSAPQAITGKLSIKVSTIAALATVGQLARVGPPSSFVVAKRTGTATFIAFTMECTHEGTITNIVNNQLDCPNHRAVYDANGTVIRQPNNGGRATNLPTFATSYDPATDILTIG